MRRKLSGDGGKLACCIECYLRTMEERQYDILQSGKDLGSQDLKYDNRDSETESSENRHNRQPVGEG